MENSRLTYRSAFESACEGFERDLNTDNGCWLKNEFCQKYGMTKESFWKLHHLIKHHALFVENKGKKGRPQLPSQYQILILLSYLRMEGDGMSNDKGRNLFNLGSGTIQACKDRVVEVMIEILLQDAVHWPNEAEREEIAKRFKRKYKFPNMVAVADGTLFPLAFKPQRDDYVDYKGRKHLYSLSTLIVNDDKRRIRYFLAGWPGTAHDERIFANSRMCNHASDFFSPHQYIMGDSAFSARWMMIPAFKKTANNQIHPDKEFFNKFLSKPRVLSEHTIGILKGRWQFLRSIRMRLSDNENDLRNILNYITVAIIIHNILIGFGNNGEEFYENDGDQSDIDEDNELNQPIADGLANDTRRSHLLGYILMNYR